MRTVRNITVAVEPELYLQTRRIAADYDTTVTDMVRFLLIVLPEAVKSARFSGSTIALLRIHCPEVAFSLRKCHLPRCKIGHVNCGTAYPGGRPQFGLAAARAARAAASAPPPTPAINPPTPSPEKSEIAPCTPVNASNQHSLQQLAGQHPASVQDKYSSKATLKSIISKVLHPFHT
jgi:hypothetical protein